MKIKQLFKWEITNYGLSFIVFCACMLIVNFVSAILSLFVKTNMNYQSEFMNMLFLFVLFLSMYQECFNFALCNSVSRKTMLVTRAAVIAVFCLILTITDFLLKLILGFFENISLTSIYNTMYRDISVITSMLLMFSLFLVIAVLGFFIASLNSRLSKLGKILLYVGTGALTIIVLPLIFSLLTDPIQRAILDFFEEVVWFFKATPYRLIGFSLLTGVIFFFFGALLTRRAPLKTQ